MSLETTPKKTEKVTIPTQIVVTPPSITPQSRFMLTGNRAGIRNVIIIGRSPDSGSSNSAPREKRQRSRTVFSPSRQTWYKGTPPRWAPPSDTEMSFAENFRLLLKTLKEGPGGIFGGLKIKYSPELFRDLTVFRKRFAKLKTESATRLANKIKAFIDMCHEKNPDDTLKKPKPTDRVRQYAECLYYSLLFHDNADTRKTDFENIISLKLLFRANATEFHDPDWHKNDAEENVDSAAEIKEQLEAFKSNVAQKLTQFKPDSETSKNLAHLINNIDFFTQELEDWLVALNALLKQNIDQLNSHISFFNSLKCTKPLSTLHENLGMSNYATALKTLLQAAQDKKTVLRKAADSLDDQKKDGHGDTLDSAALQAHSDYLEALISTIKYFQLKYQQDYRFASSFHDLSSTFKDTQQKLITNLQDHLKQDVITLLGNSIRPVLLTEEFIDYLISQKIVPADVDQHYLYETDCYDADILEAYALYKYCPPQLHSLAAEHAAVAQQTGSPIFTTPSSSHKRLKTFTRNLQLQLLQSEYEDTSDRMAQAVMQAKNVYENTKAIPTPFGELIETFIAEFYMVLEKIPEEETELKDFVGNRITLIRTFMESVNALSLEKQMALFYNEFCETDIEAEADDVKRSTSPLRK